MDEFEEKEINYKYKNTMKAKQLKIQEKLKTRKMKQLKTE